MSNGPTLIYDKSAMQLLSGEEANWLTHFFRCVITPVYQLEILGNISTQPTKGTPENRVASFARRAIGVGSLSNVPYSKLIDGEILGARVEMRGAPHVAAERIITSDGQVGAFIDETPEQKALRRWSEQRFSDAEREQGTGFRSRATKSTVLQDIVREFKLLRVKGAQYASTLPELLAVVDSVLDNPSSQFQTLRNALEMFDQPQRSRNHVRACWVRNGRPLIRDFLPYTHYCMRLSTLFWHGVGLRLISERPTNLNDLQYLYYLPFCQVFTSADGFHMELAPLFLRDYQRFEKGDDMKGALRQLADYYSNHVKELKTQGTRALPAYPPLDQETLIHDLFDELMPSWREIAVQPNSRYRPKRTGG